MKNRTPLIVTSLLAILITAALLLWLFNGNAKYKYTSPTSAEQLRGEFESALKAKDVNGIIGMFYWQGVSDDYKLQAIQEIGALVNAEWTAVRFSRGWLLVVVVFISLALLVDLVVAPSLRSRGDGFAASILWGASFVAAGAWLVIYLIFKIRGYFRKH